MLIGIIAALLCLGLAAGIVAIVQYAIEDKTQFEHIELVGVGWVRADLTIDTTAFDTAILRAQEALDVRGAAR